MPPATSTATPLKRNTEHTNALRSLWPEGIFASQLAVMGSKDRDGAQKVAVGFLIGAVADVQLVHHLFPRPSLHVAQLQDAAPQAGVCLPVIRLRLLNGFLPPPVAGAIDPVPLPIKAEGLLCLPTLLLCHRSFSLPALSPPGRRSSGHAARRSSPASSKAFRPHSA